MKVLKVSDDFGNVRYEEMKKMLIWDPKKEAEKLSEADNKQVKD
jgi:hypothetical protein